MSISNDIDCMSIPVVLPENLSTCRGASLRLSRWCKKAVCSSTYRRRSILASAIVLAASLTSSPSEMTPRRSHTASSQNLQPFTCSTAGPVVNTVTNIPSEVRSSSIIQSTSRPVTIPIWVVFISNILSTTVDDSGTLQQQHKINQRVMACLAMGPQNHSILHIYHRTYLFVLWEGPTPSALTFFFEAVIIIILLAHRVYTS